MFLGDKQQVVDREGKIKISEKKNQQNIYWITLFFKCVYFKFGAVTQGWVPSFML